MNATKIRISILSVCAAVFIPVFSGMILPPDLKPIAMIMKVIQEDVSRKTPTSDWQKAKRGDPLASKDMVRTGVGSFAVVKFNDNTLLKIRPNSVITIFGEIAQSTFSKSVDLSKGSVDFDVAKQRAKEKFEFTTPTSVASIRGTNGRFQTDSDSTDYLFINSGLAELLNLVTNQSLQVAGGQVGISHKSGLIEVRVMTHDELNTMTETGQLRNSPELEKQEFEMDFKDNQDNPHKLKIEVQKPK